MPAHTTNYFNTLIEIAEDCPTSVATLPAIKEGKTSVANYQFDKLNKHPYRHNSDEIIFGWYALRNEIPENEFSEARDVYFSKGQACLRTSPLAKKYGWGIHSNEEGKIAILPVESDEYKALVADDNIKKVKAMRTKRG